MICELKMKADGAKQRYTNFSEWIPNSASCHWVSISAVLIILRQTNHWFSVLIDEVKICKIMNQQIVVKQAGEFWCVLQPHAAWSLLLCAIENHFHCFSSLVPRMHTFGKIVWNMISKMKKINWFPALIP